MNNLLVLLRLSSRQSKFRVITTILSVILATLILTTVVSLGQGWLLRQEKDDFLSALLATGSKPTAEQAKSHDLTYISSYDTRFRTLSIKEIGVRTAHQTNKLPVGFNKMPADNEIWVTPALKRLIDEHQLLKERYQGLTIKSKFPESLAPSPDSLMLLFRISDAALKNPQARLGAISASDIDKIRANQKTKNNSQNQLFYTIIIAIGVILITPILVLVTEVARIDTTQRERKYATLSIVGATTHQVGLIITLEALPLGLAGTALGLLLFTQFGIPTLSQISLNGNAFWMSDLNLPQPIYSIIGVLIVACILLSNLQVVRRIKLSPLIVSRSNGVKKHPSMLSAIPLIAGIGGLYLLSGYGKSWYADNTATGSIVIASLLLLIIIGIVMCGPYLTYLLSFAMEKISQRASGILATYRLRLTSRNTFRSISGIVIALFVGSLLVTLLAIVQHSSEKRSETVPIVSLLSIDKLQRPLQIKITESSKEIDEALISKLENNTALADLATQTYIQKYFQAKGDEENALQGNYYDSCQQLQRRTQLLCPDSFSGKPIITVQQITVDSSGTMRAQTRIVDVNAVNGEISTNSYVIVAKNQAAYAQMIELAENIASSYRRKTGAVVTVGYSSLDTMNSAAQIKSLSKLIVTILAVVIATGGLSIFVSVVGNVYERKRTFIQLRILGANLSNLICSLAAEIAIPLTMLSAVAVSLGILSCYFLLLTINAFHNDQLTFTFPDVHFWVALFAANLLCVSLSLIAIPILAQITKEGVHVE